MDFEDFFKYGMRGRGGTQQMGGMSGGYGTPYSMINNLYSNFNQMARNYPGGFSQMYDGMNQGNTYRKLRRYRRY